MYLPLVNQSKIIILDLKTFCLQMFLIIVEMFFVKTMSTTTDGVANTDI